MSHNDKTPKKDAEKNKAGAKVPKYVQSETASDAARALDKPKGKKK